MRSIFTIAGFLLLISAVQSQSKMSFEQYSFVGGRQPGLLAPVAHYETKQKWYAEARYNYEDINTVSLYAGRVFNHDKKVYWSFTPIVGGMAGRLKGVSAGLNSECSFKKFTFTSQAQYSVSAQTRYDNFFYNWSEIYYEPLGWLYTGIACQHTRLYASNAVVDPGILLGLFYNEWSFPLYSFIPYSNKRYFVIGINWEWKHNKDKQIKSPPLVSLSPE